MIRLIVRRDDGNMAAHAGGAVLTTFTTLDVDLPELEAILQGGGYGDYGFSHVQLIGCEVLTPSAPRSLTGEEING
jgi:hypothetical protein